MSFDGIITSAIVSEMNQNILGGKIEKVYQPEADELVINIHSKSGNFKLYASCNSSHARIHFIKENPVNPPAPLSFCMLLRKHIQAGKISEIIQKGSERIIEFSIETYNELGFSVNKKLIIEIMGKHSNIILIDMETMKIIDSIKRISIDVNRYRQLLPGKIYEYPPDQGKLTLKELTPDTLKTIIDTDISLIPKVLLSSLQGISPAVANNLLDAALEKGYHPANLHIGIYEAVAEIIKKLDHREMDPVVYLGESKTPIDFHIMKLYALDNINESVYFDTLSEAMEFYFANKDSSNRIRQKSVDLEKAINNNLNKLYLKKQRLSEDLLHAEDSENYRLFGELLTASLHQIKPGESQTKVNNYYDNTEVTIPLDKKLSPSKNAQNYFKKYGKSKTAVKEKALQLEELALDIEYIESVASFLEGASSLAEIEDIRAELVSSGYLKKRKTTAKPSKSKLGPYAFTTKDGFRVLVGRNNVDNDILTFKTASPKDIWFHTKDIPGSHVILFLDGKSPDDQTIIEAASLAALHSKAKDSENVPVDYTKVRYVKKPNGAKPGMVIFTGNKTVYINPYKS
ncbi:MAG: NFACT family protein [Peptostreptococcaceae bacterium]|nr:NFACT family protein [Peptostreptococcaceae bacterium]